MKIIVFLSSRWSRITSSCMSRRISGSSALNGSSNSMISGSVASARARPDALLHPAGELVREATRPIHRGRPVRGRLRGLRVRSSLSTPWISSPNATLSTMRRCGSSPKCWKTMLIFCRRSSRSRSSFAAEHVLAVDQDLAGGRIVEPVDHPDERGLAGARQPHDDEHLAGRDVERDVAHGRDAPGLLEQRSARGSVGVGRSDDALGLRPVDLPDVAARNGRSRLVQTAPLGCASGHGSLRRPSVGGRTHGAPAQGSGCDMSNGSRASKGVRRGTLRRGWPPRATTS